MTGTPAGFAYLVKGDSVTITHRGRHAATLRGSTAVAFIASLEFGDAQEVMARVTGNYKRGNERQAKNHPRNR